MVRFLGQGDTLEKGLATHSNILAWRIPCTVQSGGLQSMGLQKVGHNQATETFTFKVSQFSKKKKKKKSVKLSLLESTNKEASQMAQQIKNQPAMQETQEMWVHSLSLEDPLK